MTKHLGATYQHSKILYNNPNRTFVPVEKKIITEIMEKLIITHKHSVVPQNLKGCTHSNF